jgi:hypothetical protein
MHLPPGWVQMPEEVVQEFSAKARKMAPGLPERVYA